MNISSSLLKTLMKAIPDRIYFKDLNCRFTSVNPSMRVFLGVKSDDELVGKSDHDFFLPEHADQALADEKRIMATGQPIIDLVEKEVKYDGKVTWVSTTKVPMWNEEGRLIGTCGISHDITSERDLLEKTLTGSIALLMDLLNLVEPRSFAISQKLGHYLKSYANAHEVEEAWMFDIAALLSQIGFVTVPSDVVAKIHFGETTLLTASEVEMMGRATQLSHQMIRNIPRLEKVAEIVLYQHKCFDGTGAPEDARQGEAIPRASRLLKIASALIESETRGMSKTEVFARLRSKPAVFDLKLVNQIAEIEYRGDFARIIHGTKRRRSVKVSELSIGDRLVSAITTKSGMVVAAIGTDINALSLERIRNFSQRQPLVEPILVE